MNKALSVFIVIALSAATISAARADDSTAALEARIADLEKRLAEVEARLNQSHVAAANIIACTSASANLRSAPIGFSCRTSQGAIFTKVSQDKFGEAWKGTDGTVWGDIVGSLKAKAANDQCQSIGALLPTQSNFERGEANGFREVLPSFSGRYFWSSTDEQSDEAYSIAYFDGDSGQIGYSLTNVSMSYRCVTR